MPIWSSDPQGPDGTSACEAVVTDCSSGTPGAVSADGGGWQAETARSSEALIAIRGWFKVNIDQSSTVLLLVLAPRHNAPTVVKHKQQYGDGNPEQQYETVDRQSQNHEASEKYLLMACCLTAGVNRLTVNISIPPTPRPTIPG